ncbi:hypothetical protein C5167_050322 [Papaver somniferum]|uniref:Fe2OG dioxygenase domain-containing protein n=1 Tax=Papaver somniferum TaxID=3469 RepID=A0A4Y7KS95_PAPSO|nr:hypothetical protein C5167_050322 [Papaver somniferum]
MSLDGSVERRRSEPSSMQINGSNGNANENGGSSMMLYSPTSPSPRSQSQSHQRLRLNPNTDHNPENYEDLKLEFNPCIFSSLERYLPPSMLTVTRQLKVQYMNDILARYLPQGERIRVQRHREYRQKIIANYQLEQTGQNCTLHPGLDFHSQKHFTVLLSLVEHQGKPLVLLLKQTVEQYRIEQAHISSIFAYEALLVPVATANRVDLGSPVYCNIFEEGLSVLSTFGLFLPSLLVSYAVVGFSSFQPLHRELYTMDPATFFVQSFVEAINKNTEESLRSIISEPSPGVYTFEMLHQDFCKMLLSEVDNFEKWVSESKFRIMRPNTMNKYGAVLDDFGLETMLDKLMDDFIRPISKVFFPEVGGPTLDSHHGFVVEYGKDRDVDLGFHVDDSEVTLNVCLGKQFSGGDLFFRGIRCDKHVNTESQPEESFDYSHVAGQAVLHRGRHRHGARATRSGHRINLLLWCRSSAFRELKKYQKDFSAWCGECQREKRERQRKSVAETKQVSTSWMEKTNVDGITEERRRQHCGLKLGCM